MSKTGDCSTWGGLMIRDSERERAQREKCSSVGSSLPHRGPGVTEPVAGHPGPPSRPKYFISVKALFAHTSHRSI
jgi:hypothetical protein